MSNSGEKAVLDRIVDGERAVLFVGDNEEELLLSAGQLPEGAAEGDWLRIKRANGNVTQIEIDEKETDERMKRIREKMRRLRERGAG